MTKKNLSIFIITIVLTILLCTGCATMVADAVVSGYPTYQEVSTEWPNLKDGYGRVLIYFPRQGAKSFNPLGTGGMVVIPISIDDAMESAVGDRTFVFADLMEGKHIVTFKGPTRLYESKVLEIKVTAGDVLYIEVDSNYIEDTPPHIVDETEALIALEKIHHNYKEPLPFHDQPKRAMRAM